MDRGTVGLRVAEACQFAEYTEWSEFAVTVFSAFELRP